MKTGAFLTMAPVLLFPPACTGQENTALTERPVPITLHQSTGRTKSILSGTELPESYTIYASSYFTGQTEDGCGANYFVARPFRSNGGIWSASPAVFWPLGGKLDFLFVACEDTAIDIAGSTGWNGSNCTKGVEIRLRDGDCTDSEILFATTLDRSSDGGSVPIQFKHSQSWLQFVIESGADVLRIDRIVIEDAYTGGTLRVCNEAYTDAEWSFRGHSRGDVTVPGSEGITPVAGRASVCDILLPEQDACDIALHCSIRSSPDEGWSAESGSVFRYKAGKDPWRYGEKTVYKIVFSPKGVSFTPFVGDWENDRTDIILAGNEE